MRIETYIKERSIDLESEEIDSPIIDSPEEASIEEKQVEVVEEKEPKQSGVLVQTPIGTSMSDLIDQFEGAYEKKKAKKEEAERLAKQKADEEARQLAKRKEAIQRELDRQKLEEQERANKKAKETQTKIEIEEALKAVNSIKEVEPVEVSDAEDVSSNDGGTTKMETSEDIFGDLELREVNVAFEGVGDFYDYVDEPIKTVVDGHLVDASVTDIKLAGSESEYEAKEFAEAVAPIIEEVTDKAIDESLKFHNEKTRMDVHDALNEEVAYRLGKYERKRKARKVKDIIGTVIKYTLILLVIIIIWGNEPIRLKIIETATNLFDIVQGLINGEEVNSNKFFQDLFNIKIQKGV